MMNSLLLHREASLSLHTTASARARRQRHLSARAAASSGAVSSTHSTSAQRSNTIPSTPTQQLVDSVADVLDVPQQQPSSQHSHSLHQQSRKGSRAWPYMRVRPTRSVGSMAGATNKMLQIQGRMLLECSNDDGLYALLRVLRCARTMLQKEEAHMPVWLPSMLGHGKRATLRPGVYKNKQVARRGRHSLRPVAPTPSQRAMQQRLLQLVRAGSLPRTLAAQQAAARHAGTATVMYKLHVRKLLAGSVVPSCSLWVVKDSSLPRLAARILRFFAPALGQNALRRCAVRHGDSRCRQEGRANRANRATVDSSSNSQAGILCLSSYGPIAAIESIKAICLARRCLRLHGRDICVVLDAVGVDIDNAWAGSTVINKFMIMECAWDDPTKQLLARGSTYVRSSPAPILSEVS